MLAFLLQVNSWMSSGQAVPLRHLHVVDLGTMVASSHPCRSRTGRGRVRTPRRPRSSSRSWTRPRISSDSVLDPIIDQHPTEVIVVINGPRNQQLEKVCAHLGRALGVDRDRRQAKRAPGRRRTGQRRHRGPRRLRHHLDQRHPARTGQAVRRSRIGGVTTRQRIIDPARSVLTRWADWLENVRNEYSMPAMSVLGTVGCLPGRTIAFRRSILVNCMAASSVNASLGSSLRSATIGRLPITPSRPGTARCTRQRPWCTPTLPPS